MKNTDQQGTKITDSFQFLPAISDDTAMEPDPKNENAKRTHTRTPGDTPPPKKGGSPLTTDPYMSQGPVFSGNDEEEEKIWGHEQGSKSPSQHSEERAMDTRYQGEDLTLKKAEAILKKAQVTKSMLFLLLCFGTSNLHVNCNIKGSDDCPLRSRRQFFCKC